MRVFVAGAASWDLIVHVEALPAGPESTTFARESYETVGSTGAGKALNLARLGHEVHLHTLLGDDDAGERVRASLEQAGVAVHADPDAVGTERHVNLMLPDGSRHSVYRSLATPRPDLDLAPALELALACDVIVLNITDYVRRLVPPVRSHGRAFWTDLHDWNGHDPYHRDFAEAASYVVLSDARTPHVDRLARRTLATADLVLVTRGSLGATAYLRDAEPAPVPPHPAAQVIDTNGAGDAFTAGAIHGLHLGWDLRRACRAGAAAGALAVGSRELASPDLSADLLERLTRER